MKAAAQAAEVKRRQAQEFAQPKPIKKAAKQEDMFAPKKPEGTLFQKGASSADVFLRPHARREELNQASLEAYRLLSQSLLLVKQQ